VLSFDHRLDRYADLAVRVGAGVQNGQRVILRAPVECAPFARRVVAAAYRAGARRVDVIWSDDAVTLTRYELAPRESFDEIATWHLDPLIDGAKQGAAFITVSGADPDLLRDQDQGLVARQTELTQRHMVPFLKRTMSNEVSWTIVAAPVLKWAAKVFPDAAPARAVERLWEVILTACRADRPDPVAAWNAHKADLQARRARLTAKQYAALRYTAPGTALTVGLPRHHVWRGGVSQTPEGNAFVPNIPTEEVFTLPHKERVNGTVRSTKPLSYSGTLIRDFGFTFEAGRITELHAETGRSVLERLIATDEGARRLGEVALVPHGSPISASGVLFYNTLYDENASSHLAIGRAYSVCLEGGPAMSEEELSAAGANHSLTHVDFMIGSAEMDVDGLTESGGAEPVMRHGEWVD
jgi:aminopeptidase